MDVSPTASCRGRQDSPNVGRACALSWLVHPTAEPPLSLAPRPSQCDAHPALVGSLQAIDSVWLRRPPGCRFGDIRLRAGCAGRPSAAGCASQNARPQGGRIRRRYRAREVEGRSRFQTARGAECARHLECGPDFEEEPAFSRRRAERGRLSPSSQSSFTRLCRISPTRPWVTGSQPHA